MPQQVKRINLLTSVGNSSKQIQQTSGSSVSNRPDGDESAVDEVAVDEVVVDEVVVFLSMVCGTPETDRFARLSGGLVGNSL